MNNNIKLPTIYNTSLKSLVTIKHAYIKERYKKAIYLRVL